MFRPKRQLEKLWNPMGQRERSFDGNENLLGSWYKTQTPRLIPQMLTQQVFGSCDLGDLDEGGAQTTLGKHGWVLGSLVRKACPLKTQEACPGLRPQKEGRRKGRQPGKRAGGMDSNQEEGRQMPLPCLTRGALAVRLWI